LILAGWLTFANAYILGLAAGIPLLGAYGPCSASQQYSENCGMGQAIFSGIMAVPRVGPLVVAGYVFTGVEGGGAAIGLFFLLDSFIQIAGLAIAIAGHVKRYNTLKKIKGEKTSMPGFPNGRFGIAAAPFVSSSGGGIAVRGSF
jgi:hypothetical protein